MAHHLPPCRLIRLDSRGRGGSQWVRADSYTLAQEAQDVLALLDHLGLAQAAIIGTSRGGLVGMLIAATARERLLGLCLNDVGPVVERKGLERIAEYAGVRPVLFSLEEVADRLPARSPGFVEVPAFRWAEEAVRHFVETPDGLDNPYDPAIGEEAMADPMPPAPPVMKATRPARLLGCAAQGAPGPASRHVADVRRLRRAAARPEPWFSGSQTSLSPIAIILAAII